MALRVSINGFGRIGRLVLRSIIENDRRDIEVVAINDPGSVETNVHLLKYDSVHGRLPHKVHSDGSDIIINDKRIAVTSERNPAVLPHGDMDIDIVLECTGRFNVRDQASLHLDAGAKRVLVSAPAKNADKTIVYGVNHHTLTADDVIVSNASCTTNCLAPVAKVLNDAIGIERGYMTTVHAYTGDQYTLDRNHKDLARARAAGMSMIPTSTGAAAAVGLVLPELAGKINGSAIRVPTPNVSLVDLVFDAGEATSVEAVNGALKSAADGVMAGVLAYSDAPLVSTDFNHTSASSTVALGGTNVTEGKLVRVMSWYDNEWGFATRMADTALVMGKFL